MDLPNDIKVIRCPTNWYGIPGFDTYMAIYFLNGKEPTFIDSGVATTPTTCLFPYLKNNNIPLKNISKVINTHGHMDHMGGNFEIKEKCQAKIAVHELDVPWVEDHQLHFQEFMNKYPRFHKITDAKMRKYEEGVGKSTKVDIKLHDNDVITAGDRELLVIHAGNHSPGISCLYDKSDKIIFTGDVLQGNGSVALDPSAVYYNVESYHKILKKIKQLNVNIILPGHPYRPLKDVIVTGENIKKYLDACAQYIKEAEIWVLEYLRGSEKPRDLGEISDYILTKMGAGYDLPKGKSLLDGGSLFAPWWIQLNFQTLHTAMAHLNDLQDKGKVRYVDTYMNTWEIK